ncbi:MAG: helix-turn-helix transcriptional regulator [Candidatus Eremiobacteraeota bacterium]|nr:helix-turn-helix transcriptional regulator [Candidatus Eremiobacteraeota bacterium]
MSKVDDERAISRAFEVGIKKLPRLRFGPTTPPRSVMLTKGTLRSLRRRQERTQHDIAAAMGTPQGEISNIERRKDPHLTQPAFAPGNTEQ